MKTKLSRYDYGECEVCDTPLVEKRINQDFWIGGQLIVVENVPAGVCPQCGAKVVNATVGRHLAELVRDKKRIAEAIQISVPALAYH
ncbi:MAG: YgiT-type zinc finger protein [Verrucomicrobia bacterium]|nr:YgiT-type zinc finger protein [Verrucomicrobiota bacterium]